MPANDFRYYTPDGVAKNLYSIQAPFLLLYFYNPECHSCKDIKARIEASEMITKNIKSGRLKLLAMYTDRDQTLWRKYLPENPAQWLNGRDTAEYLWNNKIYDLRAIPSLYLLDKEKKVLLKDCMLIEEIEKRLQMGETAVRL